MDELYKKYPWLKITTTVEKYVDPNYYDQLLKPYIFSGKTDLNFFSDFLRKNYNDQSKEVDVLELGCGNGRATDIFLREFKSHKYNLDLVDLSSRMLESSKKRFAGNTSIRYINSDSIKYLQDNKKVYDLIFSLWSYSHSAHQILSKYGLHKGKKIIAEALTKTISKNMKMGSRLFLIHFDSRSDEQRILIQQWRKVFPIFKNGTKQSPSKLIVDEILENLERKKIIKYKGKHYVGKPIHYPSIDKALEIFMNFHMESFFNESLKCKQVIKELLSYLHKFEKSNGSLDIKPGCYIYTLQKTV